MMDYEIFKAVVKENFFAICQRNTGMRKLEFTLLKRNRTLDGLTVLPKGNTQVFPTVYINEVYEHYRSCYTGKSFLWQMRWVEN